MAKTIKELAKENTTKYGDVEAVSYLYFIKGANAVVNEIENIINENEDGCLALERIQLRLSELKGE